MVVLFSILWSTCVLFQFCRSVGTQTGSYECLHVLINPLRITPNGWVDYDPL